MDFFVIDSTNTEIYIRVDKIISIRCKAKFNDENRFYTNYPELKKRLNFADPDYDYSATITFDCGAKEEISFSAFGWEDFLTAISKKNKKCKCKHP